MDFTGDLPFPTGPLAISGLVLLTGKLGGLKMILEKIEGISPEVR